MHGRSCSCLLVFFLSTVYLSAVVFPILTPVPLSAQSDHARAAPDFSLPPSLPYPVQPPIEGPARPPGGIPPPLPGSSARHNWLIPDGASRGLYLFRNGHGDHQPPRQSCSGPRPTPRDRRHHLP